ncbi:hypothetical protein K438DRAFT_1780766 [Mycena galopus ATCC 62051]|nr:hypothetical protein K438DRAFT_1780766 [Mycena galopus ATCC 62051]
MTRTAAGKHVPAKELAAIKAQEWVQDEEKPKPPTEVSSSSRYSLREDGGNSNETRSELRTQLYVGVCGHLVGDRKRRKARGIQRAGRRVEKIKLPQPKYHCRRPLTAGPQSRTSASSTRRSAVCGARNSKGKGRKRRRTLVQRVERVKEGRPRIHSQAQDHDARPPRPPRKKNWNSSPRNCPLHRPSCTETYESEAPKFRIPTMRKIRRKRYAKKRHSPTKHPPTSTRVCGAEPPGTDRGKKGGGGKNGAWGAEMGKGGVKALEGASAKVYVVGDGGKVRLACAEGQGEQKLRTTNRLVEEGPNETTGSSVDQDEGGGKREEEGMVRACVKRGSPGQVDKAPCGKFKWTGKTKVKDEPKLHVINIQIAPRMPSYPSTTRYAKNCACKRGAHESCVAHRKWRRVGVRMKGRESGRERRNPRGQGSQRQEGGGGRNGREARRSVHAGRSSLTYACTLNIRSGTRDVSLRAEVVCFCGWILKGRCPLRAFPWPEVGCLRRQDMPYRVRAHITFLTPGRRGGRTRDVLRIRVGGQRGCMHKRSEDEKAELLPAGRDPRRTGRASMEHHDPKRGRIAVDGETIRVMVARREAQRGTLRARPLDWIIEPERLPAATLWKR